MARVYSPNVIEIAVQQTYHGRPVVNVWHMYLDSETFGPGAEAVVEDFLGNWQDHVMLEQVAATQLLGAAWRSLDAGSGALGFVEPIAGKRTSGAVGSDGMPPNVAMLVQKRTSDRPRGRRDGRSFLVGFAEAGDNGDGILSQATIDVIDAALQDFYDGISDTAIGAGGDSYPVVLETTAASRAPGLAPVTIGSRRVTSIRVDGRLATQRDRLR